jgi:hypothetical protein
MQGTLWKFPLVDPVPAANGIPFPGGCLAALKRPPGNELTIGADPCNAAKLVAVNG